MLQVLAWILQPHRRWAPAGVNKDHFSRMPVVPFRVLRGPDKDPVVNVGSVLQE